jgi:hypothetical protein
MRARLAPTEHASAIGGYYGPHNIHENRPDGFVSSTTLFATLQNAGIRVYDISDQYRPEEVAAFLPPKPPKLIDGRPNRPLVIQSCDVYVDKAGLVYANDYNGGPREHAARSAVASLQPGRDLARLRVDASNRVAGEHVHVAVRARAEGLRVLDHRLTAGSVCHR